MQRDEDLFPLKKTFTMPYSHRGGKIRMAKGLGIGVGYLSDILNGKRRASMRVALILEKYFIRTGVPMNRWDITHGVRPGQSFEDYVNLKYNPPRQ